MDQIEERLAEEIRKYDHLYNPSLTEYKDTQMASNSLKDISANVGLQVDECTKLRRKIRDNFVCQKKGMRSSMGDHIKPSPAGLVKHPSQTVTMNGTPVTLE
ncbi:unnamed protein product [Pleuronectes platessa]|uniref:MADF domain-containing protein n=1 Tax=Pleuronectes platessa TaxID=8262 RepID=A0A9N7V9X2_PLEPL|nr:unnamed protein product [Pleuronectes platessa]